MDFITVAQASQIVLENTQNFGVETIPFQESKGRILAEEIQADRDFPPFDRVTMDGIAIQGKVYESGQKTFAVASIQYAGEPQKTLDNKNACVEIMTGASLPKNTDSVIRYEDVTLKDGVATLNNGLPMFKNVHKKGHDRRKGEVLLAKGHQLKSADLAILATTGKEHVKVNKLPKIAIITSGDELVEVNETPESHQIRKSNIYAISSLMESFASEIRQFHLKDELQESIEMLQNIFDNYDAIILSGGVSAGKKDYLPQALAAVGAEKLFHKIQQRPGKPMWFGKKGKTLAFALPGNPVSSFMCAVRYVLPWLQKSIGLKIENEMAILAEEISFKPKLGYFLQVKLKNENGHLKAFPIEGGGSGDLANLSLNDAFLELPNQESNCFEKGSVYPIWRF
ncbi:molybdopterin molybdotransferase MoeA [Arcticibacterium luteifluviistationis]|uniref:Molybdopterin molybdenumtransferase n=1 Tax=Arcticibacterium luteifluviistationis TaxID=1784714 RepID=A0A2Z4GEY7_9BACT|nr:molybdopterin molybdotransferase MoeA [Arcticibacterium luteifluviistationis]AWV99721.1 molybdopterin molybdenumtransferase MoeA [Arcticibacterium luteifluviistationis]